jgi:hypothetical protein
MGTKFSMSYVYQQCNILENQNNLKVCSICLENLNENEGTKEYQCTHLYHSNCINNWNGSCPTCRAQRLPSTLRIITNYSTNNNSTNELPSITDDSIEGFTPFLDQFAQFHCTNQPSHSNTTTGTIEKIEIQKFIQFFFNALGCK